MWNPCAKPASGTVLDPAWGVLQYLGSVLYSEIWGEKRSADHLRVIGGHRFPAVSAQCQMRHHPRS
jgi:hypothetical protein